MEPDQRIYLLTKRTLFQGVFDNDNEETVDAKPRLRSKRSQSTPAHQQEPCLKEAVHRPYTPQPPPPTQHSLFELAQVIYASTLEINICVILEVL